jgi:hypothetical protein
MAGAVEVAWRTFAAEAPVMAEGGRALIYQYGVGLGFLATIRPDGGPRLHPMCPFILDGSLLAFIIESPKLRDLLRDGRFAFHAFTPEDVDDEFMVIGVARPVDDPDRRAAAVAAYHTAVKDDYRLFEFFIDRALLARYASRGAEPTYERWRSR